MLSSPPGCQSLKAVHASRRRLIPSTVLQEAVQSAIVKGPQAVVELPSGEQVPVKSLVIPPVKGRKVVLLGDTCDSQAILSTPLPPPPCCRRACSSVNPPCSLL